MKHSRINPQLDTRIEPLGIHERDRNLSLINSFTDNSLFPVRLYPSDNDFNSISKYVCENYICIAPASVWFTKQFPSDKWIDFILKIPSHYKIYLIGGNNDCEVCLQIINKIKTISYDTADIINLAGKLSLLQTAALMKNAKMNYVNDSAPLHLASSVNAPVTAIFCSTVPAFGFGPLSDNSHIIETKDNLYCRPCGLHGFKKCPQNHFKCAINITSEQLLKTLIL